MESTNLLSLKAANRPGLVAVRRSIDAESLQSIGSISAWDDPRLLSLFDIIRRCTNYQNDMMSLSLGRKLLIYSAIKLLCSLKSRINQSRLDSWGVPIAPGPMGLGKAECRNLPDHAPLRKRGSADVDVDMAGNAKQKGIVPRLEAGLPPQAKASDLF